MYYSTHYMSPVGNLLLASSDTSLIGLWIEGQKYFRATAPEAIEERKDIPVLNAAKDWLDRYFSGKKPAVSELSLAPAGSEFRRIVWDILCEIPYGEVATYGEIGRRAAERMGKASMSGQAVGGAVGHNPISIIIPCHRIVGSNKSLTGYAGGISKKVQLLQLEGVDTSQFLMPKKGTAL